MKKMQTFCALAALVAATSAFAATFEFKPQATAASYNWNTPSYWYDDSTVHNSLPTKDDNVWLTASRLRNVPVYIDSTTDAAAMIFRLANSGPYASPMILVVDGGSLTTHSTAYIGQKSPGTLTLQNGGKFTAKYTTYIGLLNDSSASDSVRAFDAKMIVADAESTFTSAGTVYLGQQIGGTSLLENRGTVDISGELRLGVCTNATIALGDIVSVVTNSGSITVAQDKDLAIGWMTNNVGILENTGNLTVGQNLVLARHANSEGRMRHSAGTLAVSKSVYLGYTGSGYLELAGDTETALSAGSFAIAQNDWKTSVRSRGELVITNSASLSRCGRSINAAVYNNATARIALYDNAKLSDCSLLNFGNIKTDNSFEVYDNAVVSNVDLLVLNVGSSGSGVTGKTTMKLSGNAKVCDLTNVYIGSNLYNRAELEIADNAWFGLRDNAWEGGTNSIHVARDSYQSGDATIRMRGGTIGLGIRGGLVLGSTNNNSNVKCTSRLIGYGCVTNQGDSSRTLWSRIDVRGGSVTADGEGVERDLDLRTFARISGHANEGRSNLNISGTNGWYAINKGRLRYPARDSGDSKTRPRFVGDYARLAASYEPKFVNSMRIIIKTNDVEIAMASTRYPFVDLYAPDRTDIPAGLVEDDAKNRRLGIWHGTIATGYANTSRRSFDTADVKIRYDHWRLKELMDSQVEPTSFQICLYKHDGTANGKWKKVTSYSAAEAEANGYRISGELESVSGTYNLGWFAVVAKVTKGSCIIIR